MVRKKEKMPFETRFMMWVFIIACVSIAVGIIINEFVVLDKDALFWVCSTVFQGLLALLALWGAFIIFQIQFINSQISHKESLISLRKPIVNLRTGKSLDTDALNEEIESLKKYKSRIKEFLFRPIQIIAFTITMSIVFILFNNISFKVEVEIEGMIPSIIVLIILFSIWSIQLTINALRQIIFSKE